MCTRTRVLRTHTHADADADADARERERASPARRRPSSVDACRACGARRARAHTREADFVAPPPPSPRATRATRAICNSIRVFARAPGNMKRHFTPSETARDRARVDRTHRRATSRDIARHRTHARAYSPLFSHRAASVGEHARVVDDVIVIVGVIATHRIGDRDVRQTRGRESRARGAMRRTHVCVRVARIERRAVGVGGGRGRG